MFGEPKRKEKHKHSLMSSTIIWTQVHQSPNSIGLWASWMNLLVFCFFFFFFWNSVYDIFIKNKIKNNWELNIIILIGLFVTCESFT